jgi:hypothetical protein
MQFCSTYNLQYLQPAISTVACYITFLAKRFTSAQSVHNYVSGIRTMHRSIGLEAAALDSYPVACLLRASKISMRRAPHCVLPISTQLLIRLCQLCDSAGPLGPSMKAAFTLMFFGMLRAFPLGGAKPPSS